MDSSILLFWASIFGTILTLSLGAIFGFLFNNKKINKTYKNTDDLLVSKDNLSKEHNDLSKEHISLFKEQTEIKTIVSNINLIMAEEKGKSSMSFNILNDSQKELRNSVSKISDFGKLFDEVMLKNKQQSKQITDMLVKISRLEKELLQEKEVNNNLSSEIVILENKINSNTKNLYKNLTKSNEDEELER